MKPTGSLWLNLGDNLQPPRPATAPGTEEACFVRSRTPGSGHDRRRFGSIRNKVVWAEKPTRLPTSVREPPCPAPTRCSTWQSDPSTTTSTSTPSASPIALSLRGTSAAEARRAANGRRPRWAGPRWPAATSRLARHEGPAVSSAIPSVRTQGGRLDPTPPATDRGRPPRHVSRPISSVDRCWRRGPERVCAHMRKSRGNEHGQRAYRAPWRLLGDTGSAPVAAMRRTKPGLVLDPFIGRGATVAIVAEANRRDWAWASSSTRAFARLAEKRIERARRAAPRRREPKQRRSAA